MNQPTVSDMVAALRYYDDLAADFKAGDISLEDIGGDPDAITRAQEKWFAALQEVTKAMPDPETYTQPGASVRFRSY